MVLYRTYESLMFFAVKEVTYTILKKECYKIIVISNKQERFVANIDRADIFPTKMCKNTDVYHRHDLRKERG